MSKTIAEVIEMGKDVQMVDLRFTDLLGMWQHFSLPARELTPALFDEGIGFDGSSIRAFQEIHESDMILIPDPDTAFMDPIYEIPTMVIICDIYDPMTRQPYTRDARYVAKKAEAYLNQTGLAHRLAEHGVPGQDKSDYLPPHLGNHAEVKHLAQVSGNQVGIGYRPFHAGDTAVNR